LAPLTCGLGDGLLSQEGKQSQTISVLNCFTWPSLMAVSQPDTVAVCLKTPWTMSVPCFQAHRISQSQTIGPLSRWCLAIIALQDKGNNRIT
jgi:hypothetical protein